MVTFPVHQVWPKPSCQAQWKGEEDKADKGRGGKTTSRNGEAWSLASPKGSGEQGIMEKTGCKIICGAPTTLVVKGLMMMMMCVHDRERRQDKERETAFLHCHWSVYISNSPWSRWHRPHKFYRQGWGSKQSCHGVVALPLGLQHTHKKALNFTKVQPRPSYLA